VFKKYRLCWLPASDRHAPYTQRGHDFVLPNIKYDFNKRHFIARSLFIMCTCMYCMNCFFISNVVRLLSYVNMCACHVYFTIYLFTYLHTASGALGGCSHLPVLGRSSGDSLSKPLQLWTRRAVSFPVTTHRRRLEDKPGSVVWTTCPESHSLIWPSPRVVTQLRPYSKSR